MKTRTTAWCTAVIAAAAAGALRADELRNVKPGQPVPAFSLPALDGSPLGSGDFKNKVVVLVYLSARQRRSELAAADASAVWRDTHRDDVALVFATADVGDAGWFRSQRAAGGLHGPVLLDADRRLYGDLGLIVLPTTIVIDREGRLAHVLSSHKADYPHVLRAYAEHARGDLDDEGLVQRLAASTVDPNEPAERIARRRAAAAILRESGLIAEAEGELRAALEIEPAHDGARLDLAALLIEAGRLEEAEAAVSEVLRTNPAHRRGRLLYGILLYHGDELDKAEAVLSETLTLNPDPVLNHYYLGLILERKGDCDGALEHYRQSLRRLLEARSP